MSKTNTNQASEELSHRQKIINCFNGDDFVPVRAIDNIQNLIRTEKLKLLDRISSHQEDFNQASEDELRYVLRHTKVTAYAAGKPYVVNLATVIQKEDIDAILALIRTENRAKNNMTQAEWDKMKLYIEEYLI